jgi:beta-glucosidase
MHKLTRAVLLAVVFASLLFAQAPGPNQSANSAQTQAPSRDVEQRAERILRQMTLEEKIDMIGGYNSFYIRGYDRLGLPELKMADGPIGVRNYGPSTAYAGGIGLAASWDPQLANRVGTMIGKEARARGVHFMLGPGVNIYRAPMAGRDFEYFGEDPFLASRTAVEYIKGIQSQGVIATVKHYAANNQEYNRHHISSEVDERTLREIYLPTFEAAVKEAHVGAIMDSYNLINGVHASQNDFTNNQIAKKEWGFDGIIMSDWDSTYDGIGAANGGLDLEMPSAKFMNRATLLPAIKAGKVSEATIDDKIRRILRKAIQFGFLDHPQTDANVPLYNTEARQLALDTARGGIVLLKNEGNLLPLDKSRIKSVAVIGPNAYPTDPVGGGSARVVPYNAVSVLEGVTDYLGSAATVHYHRGIPADYRQGTPPVGIEGFDATKFITAAQNGEPGLKAEYFNNPELQGTPAVTRNEHEVRNLPREVTTRNYTVRWSGYYIPKNSGTHKFWISSPGQDRGREHAYRLYIDDKLVLDRWQRYNATLDSYRMQVQAGNPYRIRFEYFNQNGQIRTGFGVVDPDTVVDPEAKQLASRADVAIVCVGFIPSLETEGADHTFELPPGQDELITQMLKTNKNTIVVLTAGGGVDMTQWIDQTPALVDAWYPGQEGGTAIAQMLFGEFSPSGKLPVSFERTWQDNATVNSYYPRDNEMKVAYSEGLFLGYRHFDKTGKKPLFPFGYGLSYTRFGYSNLTVSPATGSGNEPVTVGFDVKNTGNREGAEVAEVYLGDGHASVPRPVKELKGFTKVDLKPGESRHVTVSLDRRAMSYYDVSSKQWKADPGEFQVLVGPSSAQIELRGKFTLQAGATR